MDVPSWRRSRSGRQGDSMQFFEGARPDRPPLIVGDRQAMDDMDPHQPLRFLHAAEVPAMARRHPARVWSLGSRSGSRVQVVYRATVLKRACGLATSPARCYSMAHSLVIARRHRAAGRRGLDQRRDRRGDLGCTSMWRRAGGGGSPGRAWRPRGSTARNSDPRARAGRRWWNETVRSPSTVLPGGTRDDVGVREPDARHPGHERAQGVWGEERLRRRSASPTSASGPSPSTGRRRRRPSSGTPTTPRPPAGAASSRRPTSTPSPGRSWPARSAERPRAKADETRPAPARAGGA